LRAQFLREFVTLEKILTVGDKDPAGKSGDRSDDGGTELVMRIGGKGETGKRRNGKPWNSI